MRARERNRTLVEQSSFDGKANPNTARAQSEPINGTYSRPLEKGLHLCFKHAHELLIDIRKVIDSNVIRQEELAERIDDKLHLMLMQLIRTHTSLEEMGLVTRVDPGAGTGFSSSGFEPVVTNKNRPPISTLFSDITQNENPMPPELQS